MTECQVEFVLIIFYYFSQHSITIFAQHLTTIFLHVLYPHYNRKKLLTKMQFRRSKSLSYKTFCGHFPCAFLHANHKLTQLYHTIHLTICQVKIVLIISMYFLQDTTINFLHIIFFHKHFCAFPSHHVYSKRLPTILPVRRACYMNTFVWAARPSIFYVSMLNDFVADNYGNILRVSIFDCSGFLCAREYHFLSEVQKNRLAPPIFHIKNISVQSALCWMYHPLTVGHEC